MNRNIVSIILILIALGLTFTFTTSQYDATKKISEENTQYTTAIDNSLKLIKTRDAVLQTYNSIKEEDKNNLNKILPDNVDNVRLIIDVSSIISERHNTPVKNIKTSTDEVKNTGKKGLDPSKYSTVGLSFNVSTTYENFISILKDLEKSLRIMDVSRISFSSTDVGNVYDFNVDIKTYWLKQ